MKEGRAVTYTSVDECSEENGLTDNEKELKAWAKYVSNFKNVERVDILPFHQMASYKWEGLGRSYELKDTPAPSKEDIKKAEEIFKSFGLNTLT